METPSTLNNARIVRKLLPAHASEQGNVIGSVRIVYNRKKHLLVNEKRRCRDG